MVKILVFSCFAFIVVCLLILLANEMLCIVVSDNIQIGSGIHNNLFMLVHVAIDSCASRTT
jgi:hypothetical protein